MLILSRFLFKILFCRMKKFLVIFLKYFYFYKIEGYSLNERFFCLGIIKIDKLNCIYKCIN